MLTTRHGALGLSEGYDYYLKSLYADYMALPPAEKRKHHVERTWRIERKADYFEYCSFNGKRHREQDA